MGKWTPVSQSVSQSSIHPAQFSRQQQTGTSHLKWWENSELMADGAFVELVFGISRSQKKNKTTPALPDGEHWHVHVYNDGWWHEGGEKGFTVIQIQG